MLGIEVLVFLRCVAAKVLKYMYSNHISLSLSQYGNFAAIFLGHGHVGLRLRTKTKYTT